MGSNDRIRTKFNWHNIVCQINKLNKNIIKSLIISDHTFDWFWIKYWSFMVLI